MKIDCKRINQQEIATNSKIKITNSQQATTILLFRLFAATATVDDRRRSPEVPILIGYRTTRLDVLVEVSCLLVLNYQIQWLWLSIGVYSLD